MTKNSSVAEVTVLFTVNFRNWPKMLDKICSRCQTLHRTKLNNLYAFYMILTHLCLQYHI